MKLRILHEYRKVFNYTKDIKGRRTKIIRHTLLAFIKRKRNDIFIKDRENTELLGLDKKKDK
jgi:hypothetical protein